MARSAPDAARHRNPPTNRNTAARDQDRGRMYRLPSRMVTIPQEWWNRYLSDGHAIASGALALVECGVRGSDQDARRDVLIAAVGRESGDSQAYGDTQGPRVRLAGSEADALAQAAGDEERLGDRDFGQHDRELLTADPRHPVLAEAQPVCEPGGELPQHLVADLVAVRIIHRLEVIDVAHEERQRATQPHRALDLARELVLEEAAAATARQLIDGRQNAIVRHRQLQCGRETRDAPGGRQVRPELLAAGFG